MIEPGIAKRLTAVWIGGEIVVIEAALAESAHSDVEYNLRVDPAAAHTIFNRSSIDLWQVPRPTYLQAMVTQAEPDVALRTRGAD